MLSVNGVLVKGSEGYPVVVGKVKRELARLVEPVAGSDAVGGGSTAPTDVFVSGGVKRQPTPSSAQVWVKLVPLLPCLSFPCALSTTCCFSVRFRVFLFRTIYFLDERRSPILSKSGLQTCQLELFRSVPADCGYLSRFSSKRCHSPSLPPFHSWSPGTPSRARLSCAGSTRGPWPSP